MQHSLEQQGREAFCEIGRRCWQRHFVAANDGNFSFRIGENRVLCTPTLISKGFMRPEDMVIMDLDGNQISGHRRGTSEIKIHLFIYRERPDVHSVVHVHPPHATAFTIVKQDLPKCILQEVELFLGEIPRAPYATTGTWEFARTIAPWIRHHDAILLSNHGALTIGQDPYDAYYKMETLDQYCRILLHARQLGDWQQIDVAGIGEMFQLKERLGIADKRQHQRCEPCAGGTTAGGPEPIFPPWQPLTGPLTDEPKLPPRVEWRAHAVAACDCPRPGGEPAAVTDPETIRRIVREVLRQNGIS
jgi:L-fuculose-phosphate aldolase